MTYEDPFAVAAVVAVKPAPPPLPEQFDAPTQFATPFTTMLVTSRVGIDPVTGNIWQMQGTRGMVNIGTIATPPINTAAPVISGTLAHGSTLTSTTGTWNPTGTYTYQWMSAGVAIAGATNSTYVTQTSDVGNMITCVVTASNTGGAPSATSNALGPIT